MEAGVTVTLIYQHAFQVAAVGSEWLESGH